MKKLFFISLLFFSGLSALANHITGGEMYYTLESQSGNNYTYRVTLKLYRDCYSQGAALDPQAPISIFSNADNSSVWAGVITQTGYVKLDLLAPSPCITNPPAVCYEVGYYEFTVTLPGTMSGYTVAYQRCCRIAGINNLVGSNNVGSTYTAQIPGTSLLSTAPANNSARFFGQDTVIVCANNSFCYNFGATDPDGDSLAYAFCNAYVGGTTGNPAPNPPNSPPYSSVPYQSPYSAGSPLGFNVNVNPTTGMMCGVAPPAGIYVVTVCVKEFRNGLLIATQRKDLQIKVGDCNVAAATLKPEYISCDGFTFTFQNEAPPSPLITSYYWEFGDGGTSSLATPTHTYADTGVYTIKLVINKNQQCSDSASSKIKVFPGFFPGFTSSGVCMTKPTVFTDITSTAYGFVNSWQWDFGDPFNSNDFSALQNPTYTYNQTGVKTVRFIVTSSKGCIDTVYKDITIIDKPVLSVAPDDTLICRGDFVQLNAFGNGVFNWTPLTNITNPNTSSPTVNPNSTTSYIVELNDNGCINRDTVKVNVVDFVTLQAMPDTIICAGDSLRLRALTDGLSYSWQPAAGISDPTLQNPMALPTGNTSYTITATIGGCSTNDNVNVTLVPYPIANAGPDTMICFNSSAQLNGSIVGSSFNWSPATSLNSTSVLNPTASPQATTNYVLTVFDTQGCPKPGRDTVMVVVNPEVHAFAGNDTAVVVGQPLQFNGSGGTVFTWSPPTGLNNTSIFNPVGMYDGSFDSIRYILAVTDGIGCTDFDTVLVKIFKTNPTIFVPTAFTPNRDGKNDVFRPIAVGIEKIDYFRVFNRWGQLVFSTTINGHGWDGKIGGREQGTGTFVWVVHGKDYTGKEVFAKGTVTLIR